MSYNILHGDIMEWAESYDGPPFHALLCDPPYHLTSIERNTRSVNPANKGQTVSPFGTQSKGFMGKDWDGGDIAFRPETWAALAKHLYPGAFGMAFAGSRGWHRMAVAIEDAGLIIHPTIFLWGYGSGFPKATRIDTQVDRAAGAQRQHVGTKKHQPKFAAAEMGYREKDNGYNSKERESFDITAPATELAQAWAGHRYGGQALKPATEPIIVFQKPYEGRPVDCITATGAGALWIDGGRIGGGQDEPNARNAKTVAGRVSNDIYSPYTGNGDGWNGSAGRWPANLVLSHHPDCEQDGTRRVRGTLNTPRSRVAIQAWQGAADPTQKDAPSGYADASGLETVAAWRCHPDCAVLRLGEQSGESAATRSIRVDRNTRPGYDGGWEPLAIERGHDDQGTAARFFYNADYLLDRLEAADPVGYYAKASSAEREAGLDPMQARLMRELYGAEDEVFEGQETSGIYGNETPEGAARRGRKPRHGFDESTINDGRPTPIDNPYQRGETTRRNIHPTIKPLSLARWLATLLLPPGAYAPRRLLVPFAGAGSEAIGAMLAGWEDVQGIELEADHVKIAEARIAFWLQMRYKLAPDAPIKLSTTRKAPADQQEMF